MLQNKMKANVFAGMKEGASGKVLGFLIEGIHVTLPSIFFFPSLQDACNSWNSAVSMPLKTMCKNMND